MKKGCGQVNIPEVDNSSPCDDFVYSECVIINRKSSLIKNIEGDNLNEYTQKLENYIRVLELKLKKIESIVNHININLPDVGIGVYED